MEMEIQDLYVLTLRATGMLCSRCIHLTFMTKATVGQKLCEGLCALMF